MGGRFVLHKGVWNHALQGREAGDAGEAATGEPVAAEEADVVFGIRAGASDEEGGVRLVSPVEIGTQVVKYLRRSVQAYLGHSQVNKAVIAVPAEFNHRQRKATAKAFEAAGLKVVRVLEEPTAAAVAYGLHRDPSVHHVLVVDLGGGTLDVSLLFVNEGSVQVLLTDGDNHLGGASPGPVVGRMDGWVRE